MSMADNSDPYAEKVVNSNKNENLPLSSTYELKTDPLRLKSNSFLDRNGKVALVAGSGVIMAVVTLALLIDILLGEVALPPHGIVTSDNSQCSLIGIEQLKSAGSVVDAAIATALCLGVVHPHRSGLGGGGYMLVKQGQANIVFNFMPRSPSEHNSKESILIPGEISGLQKAHALYGRNMFATLLDSASQLASSGFKVTEDLERALGKYADQNTLSPAFKSMFTVNNTLVKSGTIMKNVALSETLSSLASMGTFYEGTIADDIVNEVKGINSNDLVNYETIIEEPIISNLNGRTVITPGQPSGGPIVQTGMKILNSARLYHDRDVEYYQTLIEGMKFAFAQGANLGDVDSHNLLNTMLTDESAKRLADLIKPNHVRASATDYFKVAFQDDRSSVNTLAHAGTSGSSVIAMNDMGDVAIYTSSLNSIFGSGDLSNNGFFYNNFKTSFTIGDNTNAPGKAPLNYLSPTLVFDQSNLCNKEIAVAADGGWDAVSAIVQTTLLNVYLEVAPPPDLEEQTPRASNHLTPYVTKVQDSMPSDFIAKLKSFGHNISVVANIGDLSLAVKKNDEFFKSSQDMAFII